MNINIREYIKNNFIDSSIDDIKLSIETSIKEKEELVLPGLGVFFEILWINSDENFKQDILNIIKKNL